MLVFNSDAIFANVMENFPSYSAGISDMSIDSLIHITRASYHQEWPQGIWDSASDEYVHALAGGEISLEELDGYEECAGIAQQFCGAVYGALLAKRQKGEITENEHLHATLFLSMFLLENIGKLCPSFLEVPG